MSSSYRGTLVYDKVRAKMIITATEGGTIPYQEIGRLMGISQPGGYMAKEVAKICGEISEDEVKAGRPMLSAVVVNKSEHISSKGFFVLAQGLGRKKQNQSDVDFWKQELNEVYNTWKI